MSKYTLQQLRSAWGAGKNSRDDDASITGKWFHNFTEDGLVHNQGQVLSAQPDGHFLVQLYGWLTGGATDQKVVTIQEMTDWVFYHSNSDMVTAYEQKYYPAMQEWLKNRGGK